MAREFRFGVEDEERWSSARDSNLLDELSVNGVSPKPGLELAGVKDRREGIVNLLGLEILDPSREGIENSLEPDPQEPKLDSEGRSVEESDPAKLDSEDRSVEESDPAKLDCEGRSVEESDPAKLDSEGRSVEESDPTELDMEDRSVEESDPAKLDSEGRSEEESDPAKLDSEGRSVEETDPAKVDSEGRSEEESDPTELDSEGRSGILKLFKGIGLSLLDRNKEGLAAPELGRITLLDLEKSF